MSQSGCYIFIEIYRKFIDNLSEFIDFIDFIDNFFFDKWTPSTVWTPTIIFNVIPVFLKLQILFHG
jgi:hypothetical protein